jgi:AraC-like DNA-binding protein
MRRREYGQGFSGQRIVVIPRSVVRQARRYPLLAGLLPTDVGYFPRARRHLRERRNGVDQAIFIYCTKGEGWCEIAGKRHRIGTGDLLAIPPGVPHAYGADQKQPWTILWFHAVGPLAIGFLQELGASGERPVVTAGEGTALSALFEEVLSAVELGYSQVQLLHAAHALAHLLAVLVGACRAFDRDSAGSRPHVGQTISYMEQRLGQHLDLKALADAAHLARSQYAACFKRQTGYAPMDYFRRLKMHRACQLLDKTDLSIKAIAASLGYADQLYFSRAFKAVNEMSPLAYRKHRKG